MLGWEKSADESHCRVARRRSCVTVMLVVKLNACECCPALSSSCVAVLLSTQQAPTNRCLMLSCARSRHAHAGRWPCSLTWCASEQELLLLLAVGGSVKEVCKGKELEEERHLSCV